MVSQRPVSTSGSALGMHRSQSRNLTKCSTLTTPLALSEACVVGRLLTPRSSASLLAGDTASPPLAAAAWCTAARASAAGALDSGHRNPVALWNTRSHDPLGVSKDQVLSAALVAAHARRAAPCSCVDIAAELANVSEPAIEVPINTNAATNTVVAIGISSGSSTASHSPSDTLCCDDIDISTRCSILRMTNIRLRVSACETFVGGVA
mmetsp:Transcript_22551/g.73299  ORF Transcript_22551/g.73299 Transcript_22551/m.73299 type:complete len:208 (-) Transcript_22551:576-1199(-)